MLNRTNDEAAGPTATVELHSSAGEEDEGYDSTIMSGHQASPGQVPDSTRRTPSKGMLTSQSEKTQKQKVGKIQRIGAFLFHSGIPAFCLRVLALCIVLGAFGSLIHILPNMPSPTMRVACHIALPLSLTLFFWVVALACIHIFVVFCHQNRLFYNWNFIHYLSELEKFVAIMICIFCILFALSFNKLQLMSEAFIFENTTARYFYIKLSLGVFLTTALLAVKRHYMTGLAVAFNYSNYKDRIQESLFADRMLNMLNKSKHTYKFRMKLRANEQSDRKDDVGHGKKRGLDFGSILRSNRYDKSSIAGTSRPQASVRSAMDIFTSQSSENDARSPDSSREPVMPSSPATIISPVQSPGPFSNEGRPPVRSVASYLTESDKKLQFSEFYRLANQIIARFSNVGDYRVEIQNEAKRVASKLYKYLLSQDRNYLTGQDLLPYIDDKVDFIRAVTLIKRNSEGSYQTVVMTLDECINYAFGSQDLLRAIDGILTELYVTAKSLQTIETALHKVDFFFTLLVGLFMVVIVAIVIGDAVKLLLALSTMLSGAAFAFGTSARNMFESMIFLLVIHPFDVGDRVFIPLGTTIPSVSTTVATMSGTEALDNLIVSEMHLLSTVFERWDGVKLYVPNYVLAGKPIYNIRRSGPTCELQRIHLDFSTPVSKIEELRRRVDEYVRKEQIDFTDISRIMIDSIENCNRINVNLIYQHSTNWQDMEIQLARRSKMLTFVKETLEQLEISYLPPIQRVAIVPAVRVREDTHSNLITAGEINRLLEMAKSRNLPV